MSSPLSGVVCRSWCRLPLAASSATCGVVCRKRCRLPQAVSSAACGVVCHLVLSAAYTIVCCLLFCMLLYRCLRFNKSNTITNGILLQVKEWPVVYIIITIGAAACLLLAFFWQETSVIAGKEHSTALLSLSTCLALVDCTSSVVFLPYMSVFKPQYMTAYYIGENPRPFVLHFCFKIQ